MGVLNKLLKTLSGEAPKAEKAINGFVGKAAKAEGDRRVRVIVSTPSTDREGDQIVVTGIDLNKYLQNPVVLLQHDSNRPIARCVEIAVKGDRLEAVAEFPPVGIDATADRVYRLIQAGILNAVSIGLLPKSWEFMDDENPWDGRRFLTGEMLEFSFVTLPANSDAMILERCLKAPSIKAMEEEFGENIIPPLEEGTDETPAPVTTEEGNPAPTKETAGQPTAEADNEVAARLRAIEVRRLKLV